MVKIDKFELNLAGFNEVRNSPKVQSELLARANMAANAASAMGCECVTDVAAGRTRAHARVSTANDESARNNLENNTLLKCKDAGRR